MKIFPLIIFAFLATIPFAQAGGSLACGGNVEVIRDGIPVHAMANSSVLIEELQALLQSCSVVASQKESPTRWKEEMKSPHYIHYKRTVGASFRLILQGGLRADVSEIILPLPLGTWPDQIVVKNSDGYCAYRKYNPECLKKIIDHAEIGLSGVKPYDSLAQIKAN